MALPIAVSVALLASALDLAPAIGAEPVQNLSAAGQDAHRPRVAFDPKGNALVVWRRSDGANDRIQLRRRSASGNLGAIQTLSAAGQSAEGQRVAVDAKGNALVVWARSDGATSRIQLRRRSASGTLGPIETLSAAGDDAYDPRIAADPKGNAIVVWTVYDPAGRIELRRRSASGTLGAIKTVSIGGQEAEEPQVAVDPAGNAIVVWEQVDGANERIQLRRRAASGNLGGVQNLSAAGQDARNSQVAVDAKGRAIVVWWRSDGANSRIQLRRRTTSGELGVVKTLSAAGLDGGGPQVDLDAKGNAIVVWRSDSDTDRRIQLRRRSASGNLSAVKTLSAAGQVAIDPQVAVAADGSAFVTWERYDGAKKRVLLRRRLRSGDLGPIKTLSAAGQDAELPQVAVDADGNAFVVWSRYDGGSWRIQGKRVKGG